MEKKYLVLISGFLAFGPARIKLLVNYFSSAKKVWNASNRDLLGVGLSVTTVKNFDAYRRSLDQDRYFGQLKNKQIGYLINNDRFYPKNLINLDDAPTTLYYRGKLKSQDELAVAIVGSRKMTAYGREVAGQFAGHLARMGVTIVSGLARGVDTVAHEAALSVGGRTIAVLGCGLDHIYPPENTNLARKIINGNGAVLSEYPPPYPALRNNFATRNRIISGLAKVVLVVEGEIKSGTLLTASHAANQGREVFAVPGQITSPLSQAPHFLIKNGAKIAFDVKDILDELNLGISADRKTVEKIIPNDKDEQKILEVIANEAMHLDEVVRILGLPVAEVSARLIVMEMKGMVKSMGEGIYKKTI